MAGRVKGGSGAMFTFCVLTQVCQFVKTLQAEQLYFVQFALCLVMEASKNQHIIYCKLTAVCI